MVDIILSADEDTQEERLEFSSRIHTAYRVCMVYSTLVQAYIIGKAIRRGVTVDELTYRKTAAKILKFWNPEADAPFIEMSEFSILFDIVDDGDPEIVNENTKECLTRIRNEYKRYLDPRIRYTNTLTDADFKSFLASLPLLSTTNITADGFKLSFPGEAERFEIKCPPFITYWNEKRATAVDSSTAASDNCAATLIAVKKGINDSELRMDIALLDDSSKLKIKTVRYAANNEYLRMICNAVKHHIEWSPVNDCSCDLTFLRTLTSISSRVMEEFWQKHDKIRPGRSVAPNLKNMFLGTSFYDTVQIPAQLELEDLENTFYELFIKHGIFKTVYSLFLDTDKWHHGNALFDIYIKNFAHLTDDTSDKYKAECEKNISDHLKKLGTIVSEKDSAYVKRSRVIIAEWMAYCVLKATGLQADNLFAEEENIHSIDDYYYMIKNAKVQSNEGLSDVLHVLISFWGAMMENSIPFDESKFHRDLWRIKKSLNDCTLSELFDRFTETVDASEGNEVLEQLIGRDVICDKKVLRQVIDGVLDSADADVKSNCSKNLSQRVFISYAHEDKDRVRAIANAWRARGIDLYIDEGEMQSGNNWRFEVQSAIGSPECKLVIAFLSHKAILKDAVAWEIGLANKHAKERFPGDISRQNEFLVAVNLEDDDLDKYLENASYFEGADGRKLTTDEQRHATKIHSIIHKDILHVNASLPEKMAELETKIHSILSAPDDGAEVNDNRPYTAYECEIANFYAFLKFGATGYSWYDENTIDDFFKNSTPSGKECIFPLVMTLKETKIKRDNIALAGYEIIGSKENDERSTNYILSSKRLTPSDYYCLPNAKTTGADCSWMVEPFLVDYDMFVNTPEDK